MDNFLIAGGNDTLSKSYGQKRRDMQDLVEDLFWNETEGAWFDFNLKEGKHVVQFYPSTVSPMFAACYDHFEALKPLKVYAYMEVRFSLCFSLTHRTPEFLVDKNLARTYLLI